MWNHMQGYKGYGLMGFGWIFGLIFWGLLILGVVLVIKWTIGSSGGGGRGLTALDILKQRYASGEISEEEYHRMKKELEDRK